MSQETIEKKLAYLEETKHLIGDALVTKGQTLDSETPFRDYVQKVLDIETGYDTRDATAVASEVLKGKTFYNSQGKVEGTLVPKTGDIKKFETVEEMNQDANAQEGDLAVVYGKEIQPILAGTTTNNVIFPEEVILSNAITTSLYDSFYKGMLDFHIDISSSSFSFSMMSMNDYTSKDIMYTSSDGITYSRMSEEESIAFGTNVTFPEDMDAIFSNFMQYESDNKFKGLFIYDLEKQNKDLFNAYIGKLQADTISFNHCELKNNDFITQAKDIVSSDSKAAYFYGIIKVTKLTDDNSPAEIQCFYSGNTIICDDNNTYIGGGNGSTSILWTVDLINKTYTKKSGIQTETVTVGGASKMVWKASILQDTDIWFYLTDVYPIQKTFDYYATSATTAVSNSIVYNYITYAGYTYADSQLTLTSSSQLLPGVIGYGNDGEIEGDGSIYNHLDPIEVRKITGINVKNHSIINSNNRGGQYCTIGDVENGLIAKYDLLAHITDIDNDTSYSSYVRHVSHCGDNILIIYNDINQHTKAILVNNSEIVKSFELSPSKGSPGWPSYSIYRDGIIYMMVIENNNTLKVTCYDSINDSTTQYSTTLAYTSATSFIFGYGFTDNNVYVAIECVKAGLVIYKLGTNSISKLYNLSTSYAQYATVANCNNVNYNGYLYFEFGNTKTTITIIAINNSTDDVNTFTVSGTESITYGCEGLFATDETYSKLYLIAGDDGIVYEINGLTKTSTGLTDYKTFATNQTESNHLDYIIDVDNNTFEYTNYDSREILHSSKASTGYDLTIRYSSSSMGTNLYPSDKVEGLTIANYNTYYNNRVEHLYYSYSNCEISVYNCTIYPGKGFVEGFDFWDIESLHTKFILHDPLNSTLTPEEYQTALDTAYSIRDDVTE